MALDYNPPVADGLKTGVPVEKASMKAWLGQIAADALARDAQIAVPRDGVTSPRNTAMTDLVRQITVVGAAAGKFYHLDYQANGAPVLKSGDYAWRITEHSIAGFGTESDETIVVALTDPAPTIDRNGGLQQISVASPVRSGLRFDMLVNPAALPPLGTAIRADRLQGSSGSSGITRDGASWIINPDRYVSAAGTASAMASGALDVTTTAAGVVTAQWLANGVWWRIRLGPNGFNSLPNIIQVSSAPDAAGAPGTWTDRDTGTTDWLPPLTFSATANGDSGTAIYTGGNHGTSGSASGNTTAVNRVWRIKADGAERAWAAKAFSASRLDLTIVNDLYAYNTITAGRYAIRQTFTLSITPGGIEVSAEHQALEAVTVRIDNGLQIVTTGFQGTQLVLGGDPAASGAWAVPANAGPKSAYSGAWAVLFANAGLQMAIWMDRGYGAGNAASVASDRPLIRSHDTGTKWYFAVVAGTDLNLAAGQSYRWRGGYRWGVKGRPSPFADGFDLRRTGVEHDVLIRTPGDWITTPPFA